MLKIALNAWFIDQPTTGSGQYLTHLLAEYAAHPAGHRFLLCGHTGQQLPDRLASASSIPEWKTLHTPFDPRPSSFQRHLAKLWFEQVSFPRACLRWGADLIHVPYWASPLFCHIPTIVTIHDLIPVLLPAYSGGRLGRLYTWLVSLAARRATHVLTDSQASRQDILSYLDIPPQRVEAILLAAGDRFQPVHDPQTREQVKRKYALPQHYLLYLGGFDVRKNVPAILRAYARLRLPNSNLVIAGKLPPHDTAFTPHPRRIAAELGITDRVRLIGWVDEEDKPAVYSMAAAFVFPSQYEGFGLPPLEAMSCGTPVIVSDRGSLPEIIGRGGLFVDPDDLDALAAAIKHVMSNGTWSKDLRVSALAEAVRFGWHKTAQATIAAYERSQEKTGQIKSTDRSKGDIS
jgi:glycosyltransferase involved in cell wall biosynthesis